MEIAKTSTMSSKLIGIIFLIFGLGLAYDSIESLLDESTSVSIRVIFLLLLGISSGIYGLQQIRKDSRSHTTDKPE